MCVGGGGREAGRGERRGKIMAIHILLLLRNGLNRAYCSVSARLKCQL